VQLVTLCYLRFHALVAHTLRRRLVR